MAVLDASAFIALVHGESGSATVAGFMNDARMSSVNYSEVLSTLGRAGLPIEICDLVMEALQVEILPFTESHARVAAQLYSATTSSGLSLGDRACLAAAIDIGEQAVTADRVWADLDTSAEVVVVR